MRSALGDLDGRGRREARLERIVAIACDHGGFALEEALKVALPDVKWLDLGTNSAGSVDYSDFAGKLADAIKAARPDVAF